MSVKRPRILIGDDHAVVVEGLRRLLDRPEFELIGVADDGLALIKTALELQPDVIITDVTMPSLNGIDAAREIHKRNRRPKIIFFSMHQEIAYVTAALAAGGSGYVVKTAPLEDLVKGIRAVLDGSTYLSKKIAKSVAKVRELRPSRGEKANGPLTHRQREVLQMLAEGKQVKEIAAVLNLSPKTVEFHKYRIMALLGLHSVADLARYAQKRGMVE